MGWFKRSKEGINTPTQEKKETPEGLWHKCSSCDEVVTSEDQARNLWVCEKCLVILVAKRLATCYRRLHQKCLLQIAGWF